ncbi:hypothetical protein K3495_g12486 [Podosphaera aphanis]|nr:hypothetical protein K3495_g12486 [Podosphaera aphanis]
MKMTDAKEVLGSGISFVRWRMALQAKLGRKCVLGHVFHYIPGIWPITIPTDPTAANPNAENQEQLTIQYLEDLERWMFGEIKARNSITQRLSSTIVVVSDDPLRDN